MKVEEKGHTFIIKDTQGDITAFLMKITHQYKTYGRQTVIIP